MERLGDYSLLRFKLDTGRTHQIRVHCAHMNHPWWGIPPTALPQIANRTAGQALHAVQLGLDHPITRERMLFEAPLPPVMERLLFVLRKKLRNKSAGFREFLSSWGFTCEGGVILSHLSYMLLK